MLESICYTIHQCNFNNTLYVWLKVNSIKALVETKEYLSMQTKSQTTLTVSSNIREKKSIVDMDCHLETNIIN